MVDSIERIYCLLDSKYWKLSAYIFVNYQKLRGNPLFENENFGVQRCGLHVWKALIKWNNFKKACYGLLLILCMIQWKMC